MIPVCTETVLPCGIVVRSSDGVVDLCQTCASTDCPFDTGEWGAWRGTVMQHVEAFEFYSGLEIPYGGSLQTDFKTHGDVCRSCEYGIDYKGRSFCCKPCYWVGGRTHGVRDCSAYVRSGVGWSP